MFWGLKIMPGKTYTQKVEYPFRVTMACLGQEPILGRHCLFVRVEKQEYMLCSLNFGSSEQQSLDLLFSPGEEIVFYSSGNGPIYLSGMYDVDDLDDEEEDGDVEMNEEEDDESYSENEDEEDEDEEDDMEDEIDEAEIQKLKEEQEELFKKSQENKKAEKKQAKEEKKPAKEEKKPVKEEKKPAKEEKKPVKEEKKQPKEQKKEQAPAKEEKKAQEPEKQLKKKTLPSGLVIEDITLGNGAKAKQGKRVGVRYIGKLAKNGKVFDKNVKGAVFKFNLGKGEVIKGWDIGVNGMNVGGVRRLTIPANMAYGSRGAPPDIPPNATLIFEVKMMTVGK